MINKTIFGWGVFLLTLCTQFSFAQHAYFVEGGKIEFEKKVNMFAKLKDRIKADNFFAEKVYEDYRKNQPQFVTSKSTLSFSSDESHYQFVEQETQRSSFVQDPWLMAQNNVYHNFKTDSVVDVRKVYDDNFVVRDKKQDILWKITTETREIAGYHCRRANGLMQDSIYVVAFYAEEIIPAGGPESFSGLPGMILGAALPHENVTWFATKVELAKPVIKAPTVFPRRAKEVSRKELEESLKKSMKGWGEWGNDALKAFLL